MEARAARVLARRVRDALRARAWDDARALLSDLRALDPLSAETRGLELEHLVRAGRRAEAYTLAKQIAPLFDGSARVLYWAGRAAYATRRYDEAAAWLEEAHRIAPHRHAERWRAKALTQSGRFDEAEAALLALAAAGDPCRPDLGWLYERRREPERAIVEYERHLADHPDDVLARHNLLRLRAHTMSAEALVEEVAALTALGEALPEALREPYLDALFKTGRGAEARALVEGLYGALSRRSATGLGWACYRAQAWISRSSSCSRDCPIASTTRSTSTRSPRPPRSSGARPSSPRLSTLTRPRTGGSIPAPASCAERAPAEMPLIRDLVDVRARPTVVRLEEVAGQGWVSASFHLTPEVRAHVAALEHALCAPHGTGAFLVAPYGAGKSHFLAWLGAQLEAGDLASPQPSVLRISLLNYRAALELEAIVAGALGGSAPSHDRRDSWRAILDARPGGLVLLIDELSEFLRSKPDARAFSEDIRFLQFLGELAQSERLFVVAALQEAIEHTGAIDRESFRKIKDRFPLRLRLTPAHVRDLLSTHLLVKREGYDQAVRALAAELERALPRADVRWEELAAIYPVHPATLHMLEDVRDRFSQARGALELVLHRLAGDPARGIRPFLDRPFGELLTPDVIVEHFEDVLELQPEFAPIAQELFPFYRREMARLFPQPRLAELAWRVLRLLVVDHLRASSEGLTPVAITAQLLFAASRLEPEKNRSIVERVLSRLSGEGRYVRAARGRYRLDLDHDAGARLERLVARELAELPEPATCLEILAAADLPRRFDPFSVPRERWQPRRARWCFHERAFAVWSGDGDPSKPPDTAALCVRMPWGARDAVPGVTTLIPSAMELDPPLRELAALVRLREGAIAADVRALSVARIAERAELFDRRVREAFGKATRVSPVGRASPAPPSPPDTSFDAWLEAHALMTLRERYPRFEPFAPNDGPLPKEAYRAFMRFASARGLTAPDVDPGLTQIREGYLVKMGLLRRKGALYEIPARLDQHELVRLVLPLASSGTPIDRVYTDLGGPIYGLVPDQIHLLLLFLVAVGEIDLVKEGRSIRALSETYPLPSAYDRVVAGRALAPSERRFLELLCEGLGVSAPRDASVLAEQRAIELVRAALREPRSALGKLRDGAHDGDSVTPKIHELERWCALLDPPAEPLEALSALARAVGAASRLLDRLEELADLPARLARAKQELARVLHLARQPGMSGEPLGEPPPLGDPRAIESWLARAHALYAAYVERYRAAHDRFWRERRDGATWKPPRVAQSQHLGLGAELARLDELDRGIERARCRGLSDLTFQTRCACGFDGETAPYLELVGERAALAERVERALAAAFGQPSLRERVAAWAREGVERSEPLRAYLEGGRWPEVSDLAAFDRHLAGVSVVAHIDGSALLDALEGTWEPEALVEAFRARVERAAGGGRLRVERSAPVERESVARFCLEQALRHGVALPSGLGPLGALATQIDPSWVGEATLAKLGALGLDDAVLARVLRFVVEGRLATTEQACSLVLAACDLGAAEDAMSFEELAARAERAYRHASLLEAAAAERASRHLSALACTPLEAAPLAEMLERYLDHDWLVLDAFGLPMLGPVRRELAAHLDRYALRETCFAQVGPRTTTAAFHAELAARGVAHAFEKLDAIDEHLHQHALPFDDVVRLATAALGVGLRRLRQRLRGERPLLVTADHGFVLAADRRRFVHGGASTLERVVPVLRYEPR